MKVYSYKTIHKWLKYSQKQVIKTKNNSLKNHFALYALCHWQNILNEKIRNKIEKENNE